MSIIINQLQKTNQILIRLIIMVWSIYSFNAQAQGMNYNPSNLPTTLNSLIDSSSASGWVILSDTLYVSPDSLFTRFKSYWGLGNDDNMKLVEVLNDEIGGKHHTYAQYYKGIEVHPVIVRVHEYPNKGLIIQGRVAVGLNNNLNIAVNLSNAIQEAKDIIKAEKYAWEDDSSEMQLKLSTGDSTATYYPDSQIVLIKKKIGTATHYANDFIAAYRLKMTSLLPQWDEVLVYVNASTKEMVYYDEHRCFDKRPAYLPNYSMVDTINVTKDNKLDYNACTIFNDLNDTSFYHLIDRSQLHHRILILNDGTYNLFPSKTYNNTNTYAINYAAEALWSTEKYYDMMKSKFPNLFYEFVKFNQNFGNSCPDSIPFQIAIDSTKADDFSHYQPNYIYGSYVSIGKNQATGKLTTSLDVIGHEWTHHFSYNDNIFRKSGLYAQNEAGALGESFSDMFGFALQEYMRPKTGKSRNWIYGLDYIPIKGYRNMADPPSNGHPDYYEGTYWQNTSCCLSDGINDQCGVHTNCGVPNKWFYAIVEGANITKEGITYNIAAQNLDTLMNIIWNTILFYTTPEMHFLDARKATELLANILYPTKPSIKSNIIAAWNAVGVKLKSSIGISTNPIVINASYNALNPNSTIAIWNTTRYINGPIIIESGYTLRIENTTLFMLSEAEIIVKRGGQLIINGSILKGYDLNNDCNTNNFWKGIKAEPYYPSWSFSYTNASVFMQNSTIENALLAVGSGNNSIESARSPGSPALWYALAGGDIEAENCQFNDNVIDIEYHLDKNGTGRLNIHDCKFYSGGILGNEKKNFVVIDAVNDVNNSKTATTVSGSIQNDFYSTCTFNRNHFSSSNYLLTTRPNGIQINGMIDYERIYHPWVTKDSINFHLIDNVFTNLGVALKLNNLDKVNVLRDTFNNCKRAMISQGIGELKLEECLFKNDSIALHIADNNIFEQASVYHCTFEKSNNYSIYISNAFNAQIKENNFIEKTRSGGGFQPVEPEFSSIRVQKSKYVIVMKNIFLKEPCIGSDCSSEKIFTPFYSGNNTDDVYFLKNTIGNNWGYGTFIEGQNQGLHLKCNVYGDGLPMSYSAIYLMGNISTMGAGCSNHTQPAGNRFNWDHNIFPNGYRILRDISNGMKDSFLYYSHAYYLNSPDATPDISKKYSSSPLIKTSFLKVCPSPADILQSTSCDDSYLFQGKVSNGGNTNPCAFEYVLSPREELWDYLDLNKPWIFDEGRSYAILMPYQEKYRTLQVLDNQLLEIYRGCGDYNKMELLLSESLFLNHKLALGELLKEKGRWSEAKDVYDQLHNCLWEKKLYRDTAYAAAINLEIADNRTIFDILYNLQIDSLPIDSLSPANIATLDSIRISSSGAAVKAERVLGQYHHTAFCRPIGQTAITEANNNPLDTGGGFGIPIFVSPNPTQNQVQISFNMPESYTSGVLKIFNILNPTVVDYEETIENQEEFTTTANISGNTGIYVAVLFVDGVKRGGTIILKTN